MTSTKITTASIVVSARFKGETHGEFIHGQSYMLAVVSAPVGQVVVNRLESKGEQYQVVGRSATYDSVVSLLVNWEEITSYATIPVVP